MAFISTILAVAALGAPAHGHGAQNAKPLGYKVLYAGMPGSPREKAFVAFFKSSFAQTGTADIAGFDGSQAAGYDLVFLDFRSGNTARKKLPATYQTPTVVTGWEGTFMVDEGRAKGSNYWWECGTGQVQGEPGNHEVFKTPYPVKPKLETLATPPNYISYEKQAQSGNALPPSLQVWPAQNKIEGTAAVVTAPYSFKNGGDCEAIVLGINFTKGIDSPVVWRRENYMVWGFYALPSEQTEEGRKLFLNCLVYMAKRGKGKT